MTGEGQADETSVQEAVERLKQDPSRPVRVRIDGLEIELRVVSARRPRTPGELPLGDAMAAAGPWQGESTEEILRILYEGRHGPGTYQPPEKPRR